MRTSRRKVAPLTQKNGPRAVRGLVITALLIISIAVMLNVNLVQNAQGLDPHIVTGTVYEANGTAISGANVTIVNVRTGESSNASSNATGVYAFNLLNLPTGWALGDTIQVNTTNSTGVGGSNATQILVDTTSTTIDIWIGSTTSVTGVNFYIIDEDGYPVSSAMINIKDSAGDIVTTKLTDVDGKASTTLDDGLYTITISKSGYDDVVKIIRVHGCNYAIRIGGEEAVGITITNWWFYILLIFAIIGILTALIYLAKKV